MKGDGKNDQKKDKALLQTGTYQSLLESKRSDPVRYERYHVKMEKEKER